MSKSADDIHFGIGSAPMGISQLGVGNVFWDCASIRIFDTSNKSKTEVINSILSISLTQSILASSNSKVRSNRPVDNLLELFTVFDENPADSSDSKSDLGGQVGFSFGFESPLSGE